MRAVTRKLIKARRVSVNVCRNDPVDMRCGGPPILGFDFVYDADIKFSEMKKFIQAELKKNNLPGSICDAGTCEVPKSQLWSKAKIAKSIAGDAGYLRGELRHGSC